MGACSILIIYKASSPGAVLSIQKFVEKLAQHAWDESVVKRCSTLDFVVLARQKLTVDPTRVLLMADQIELIDSNS